MSGKIWRYSSGSTVDANSVRLGGQKLSSSEQRFLNDYTTVFGPKLFKLYQAQGLPPFPLLNAYKKEEDIFKKTVDTIPVAEVKKNAIVITSHIFSNVQTYDDIFLRLKARIAPRGGKDSKKLRLKTDSAVCLLTGIQISLLFATIFKRCLAKIDFESAFLQTGDALRDVYVVLPRESSDENHYWLLLKAAYGVV